MTEDRAEVLPTDVDTVLAACELRGVGPPQALSLELQNNYTSHPQDGSPVPDSSTCTFDFKLLELRVNTNITEEVSNFRISQWGKVSWPGKFLCLFFFSKDPGFRNLKTSGVELTP